MTGSPIEINQAAKLSVGGTTYNMKVAGLEIPGINSPVFVRPCTSDVPVLQAIFQQMEYETEIVNRGAEVIVDLGANTGLSSVFFHDKFSKSRIFAVEPSQSNFDMLTLNCAFRPRITACLAAIWLNDGYIYLDELSDEGVDLGHWAHRTIDSPTARSKKVPSLCMETLMRRYGIHEIDLLKIDIEGAEFELFNNTDLDWLRRVRVIMVETHERFKPGVDAIVTKATDGLFRELQPNGENRIFEKI